MRWFILLVLLLLPQTVQGQNCDVTRRGEIYGQASWNVPSLKEIDSIARSRATTEQLRYGNYLPHINPRDPNSGYHHLYTRMDSALIIGVRNTIQQTAGVLKDRGCDLTMLTITVTEIRTDGYRAVDMGLRREMFVANGQVVYVSYILPDFPRARDLDCTVPKTPSRVASKYEVRIHQGDTPTPAVHPVAVEYVDDIKTFAACGGGLGKTTRIRGVVQ